MDAEAGPLRHCVHETPWRAYALAWSTRPEPRFRFAVGSILEHESNRIQVIEVNEASRSFMPVAEVEHAFPPTKLMWGPSADVLAAAGTALNLYRLEEDCQMRCYATLANTRRQQPQQATAQRVGASQQAPLTSFDWCADNPQRIGTSSVDTTCTIWNIEKQKIETQLIAHDKAVYDITFAVPNLFASCGADGSVRLFDQRNLEHSTIIYESSSMAPLLHLTWNKLNKHYIATVAMDTSGVIIIDIRRPSMPLLSLPCDACVNAAVWAPHSRSHLLCGTEEGQALIWDVKEGRGSTEGMPRPSPCLAYGCDHELYQVQWGAQPEWVALGSSTHVEVLQI
mmetsp:Transcript_18154/g.42741  ORF Transcript_18154/g.42741 Transcript_18154/m.42741 type:complete len:339 (+) Transcript_18154:82-1098(+)